MDKKSKSIFLDNLGEDDILLKVLELFIEGRDIGCRAEDIAEQLNISEDNARLEMNILWKMSLIVIYYSSDKAYFKLNQDNIIGKCFVHIFDKGVNEELKKNIGKKSN